jgi:lipopolysaccharide/colanic/teichoic acid biosynthesis glycosyltransferase
LLGLLRECERLGVQLDVVPRMFELMRDGARTTRVGGLPVVGVTHSRASTAEVAAKRAIDIGGAALGLLLALPILLIVGTLVAVQDGGSPIFRQARVGQNGRLFDVLKIRTMSTRKNDRETDIDGPTPTPAGPDMATLVEQLKSDTQAVTRLGRVLRMTSIDELPQLWNVLVGEMSLVGPRPLRPFEVAALDNWEMRRQEMRPGITGLWQVEGRSEIGWSERMQLDYAYIRNWSLLSDLSLLAKTPMAVLRRQGAR